jgi:hypothetical protein
VTRRQHATNDVEDSIAYIFGRIEIQIEGFALRMGIPAAELAGRVGALLSAPPLGQILGSGDHLPYLQQAPRERDIRMEPLALAGGAHRIEAPPAAKPSSGKARITFWTKMTEQQRSEEMLRRLLKIKTKSPTMRKQIATIRKKLKAQTPRAKPPKKAATRQEQRERPLTKQRVYQLRYEAKKAGLPPPLLPRAVNE